MRRMPPRDRGGFTKSASQPSFDKQSGRFYASGKGCASASSSASQTAGHQNDDRFGIAIMRLGDPTNPPKPAFDLFVGTDDRNADHLAAEMNEQGDTGVVGPELGCA
jgi:hypothetical protein